MKDSQRFLLDATEALKYIKADNERFSTQCATQAGRA